MIRIAVCGIPAQHQILRPHEIAILHGNNHQWRINTPCNAPAALGVAFSDTGDVMYTQKSARREIMDDARARRLRCNIVTVRYGRIA